MIRWHLTVLLGLCLAFASNAATWCVRDGGSGDGSSWSSALDDLPATLTRGDTYYLADGNYSAYAFNDALSGTSVITIKKATADEHGTDTGWSSAYGDGQAVFASSLDFATGYYVIDGVTGGGPGAWESGFGIKIQHGGAAAGKIVRFTAAVSHVTIQHVLMQGIGSTDTNEDGIYSTYAATDVSIRYCAIVDVNRVQFLCIDTQRWLIEYCYLARNGEEDEDGIHREAVSAYTDDDWIIRYNLFEDIGNTGVICCVNGDGVASGWEIYGNLFNSTSTNSRPCNSIIKVEEVGDTLRGDNWTFHNNTIFNQVGLAASISIEIGTNNFSYNNMWVSNTVNGIAFLNWTHDYNYFIGNYRTGIGELDTALVASEANGELGTSGILGADLVPSSNTAAGTDLGSPYNVDILGNTRTTWTRGAYEFGGTVEFGGTAVYVSSTGSDTNVGTISHPVLTYTNAVVIAAAEGVTNIIFRDGSYPSMLVQASNIRLAAENSRQAVITNAPGYGLQTWACSNVMVEGLTIQDSYNSGIKFSTPGNWATNCWLLRNGNTLDTSGLECNAAASTNTLVENCLIELNGDFTPVASPQGHGIYASGTGQIIRNNIIRSNAGFGIQFYSGGSVIQHGALIYNNLTYGHESAYGMTVYGATESDTGAGTNYVFSNTILDGLDLEHGWARVTNNIIWPSALAPTEPINSFRSGSVPVIWTDFNVMSHAFTNGASNITTNDAHLAADYRLTADSPAVDAGTDLSAWDITTDLVGDPRGTWDIGAFAFEASDTTSPTISSVTATPAITSVTVTWTTDEAATSGMELGLTASYGTTVTNSSTVTSHSLSASGLTASTLYHFRVLSSDAVGNTSASSDGTFTTGEASVVNGTWSLSVDVIRAGSINRP